MDEGNNGRMRRKPEGDRGEKYAWRRKIIFVKAAYNAVCIFCIRNKNAEAAQRERERRTRRGKREPEELLAVLISVMSLTGRLVPTSFDAETNSYKHPKQHKLPRFSGQLSSLYAPSSQPTSRHRLSESRVFFLFVRYLRLNEPTTRYVTTLVLPNLIIIRSSIVTNFVYSLETKRKHAFKDIFW